MSMQHRLKGIDVHWHMSSCDPKQEPTFRALMDRVRPSKIVEIGTHHGVSAALLAEYAPVATIDIFPSRIRAEVWNRLGVAGRITEHVCVGSEERDAAIRAALQGADFAFVDGGHLMPDIVRDFELTIPCGRVLLHDYWLSAKAWPDVKRFVDALDRETYEVTIKVPFALVEAR